MDDQQPCEQGQTAQSGSHELGHDAAMYRVLVENSLGLVCAHDLSGRLLAVNREAARSLGYTTSELPGRNLAELIQARVRRLFSRYLERIKTHGEDRGELRLVSRDGRIVTWTYQNVLHEICGAEPIVIGHAIDITSHLSLEQKWRESSEQYRRLFDDAPVAYHEIDHHGVLVRVNKAECQLLGWRREELLGRQVWDLISQGQRVTSEKQVKRKLRGEQVLVPFLREYTRKDGAVLILLIHENLIRNQSGAIIGIRSTLLDVTEQHRAERELRRLNEDLDKRIAERTAELEFSNRKLSDFVHMVSHDLQEPLRSTSAFSSLLMQRYQSWLDEDGREFLQQIVSSTARMSRLVQDLLAFSRATNNDVRPVPVDLDRALDDALQNLREALDRSNARVERTKLPTISGHFTPMMQLFQNLIDNAVKYRSDAPPAISIRATEELGEVVVSVTDNGVGIAESDRDRVFEMFERSRLGQLGPAGSGIGLAICKAIVERHNGRIWIESAPDQGCVIKFALNRFGQDQN